MSFESTLRHVAPTFGKHRVPPLTGEQKTALITQAREAELQARRARMDAYLEVRWEENMAKLRASIVEAESAIARRRLGAMGVGALRNLAGFAIGCRLGR